MIKKTLFNKVYNNRKVFITGHTGFKGSWLSFWLSHLGAKITGYSLPPNTKPSNFEILKISKLVDNNFGDIRDYDKLKNVIIKSKPEIIFHLAAQPLVIESYNNPKYTYETNIIGLVNLLEICRQIDSIKAIVVITSDKCYRNNEWCWGYREIDELGGDDPYSSSKACAEIISNAYKRSFYREIPFATARAGNVIGGGDWSKNRIVPDCIKSLIKNKPIILRNPDSTRPWQHVLEPLSGYLHLGEKLLIEENKFSGAWNFGPSKVEGISVRYLAGKLNDIWGGKNTIKIKHIKNPKIESTLLQLDISKSNNLLKWYPVWDSDKTIINTAEWYKTYYDNSIDMFKFSEMQIENYVKDATLKNLAWTK